MVRAAYAGRAAAPLALALVVAAVLFALPTQAYTLHPPDGSNSFAGEACIRQGSTVSSIKQEAINPAPADVELARTQSAGIDELRLGSRAFLSGIVFRIDTPGVAGTVAWAYSKAGGQWGTLTVSDASNHFTASGDKMVTFAPPADWAPTTLDGPGNCAASRYWIRVTTLQPYDVRPLASVVGMRVYNVVLLVQTEAEAPVLGLGKDRFVVQDGSNNDPLDFRERGGGIYEFALATNADVVYTLSAVPLDFVPGDSIPYRADRAHVEPPVKRITPKYPLHVTVASEDGGLLVGAAVTFSGALPNRVVGANHYFAGPARAGPLAVSLAGHESMDGIKQPALGHVAVSTDARTRITFSGTAPCAAPEVAAGTQVQCAGLRALGAGPPTTSTSADVTQPAWNPSHDSEPSPHAGGSGANPGAGAGGQAPASSTPGDASTSRMLWFGAAVCAVIFVMAAAWAARGDKRERRKR